MPRGTHAHVYTQNAESDVKNRAEQSRIHFTSVMFTCAPPSYQLCHAISMIVQRQLAAGTRSFCARTQSMMLQYNGSPGVRKLCSKCEAFIRPFVGFLNFLHRLIRLLRRVTDYKTVCPFVDEKCLKTTLPIETPHHAESLLAKQRWWQ